MAEEIVLKINNLTKDYGKTRAVDGLSLSLTAGKILGLLGPNGAGKTTTINMVLGLLSPTAGNIQAFGIDLNGHRKQLNGKMNFSAVYAQLPPSLTVWQNLYLFGLLYGVKNLREKIAGLLREFGLEKFSSTRAGLLSSGELSRLNLAKAVINEPRLLLLDEPTASLDPSTAQEIREMIQVYVKRTQAAILWTSHNMYEIENVCEEVLFLSHGRVLLSGNPKTLPAERNKKNLEELFIAVAREPLSLENQV